MKRIHYGALLGAITVSGFLLASIPQVAHAQALTRNPGIDAKVAATNAKLRTALTAGTEQDVIIEFDSRAANDFAQARLKSTQQKFENAEVLAGKKSILQRTKNNVFASVGLTEVTIVRDFDTLPLLHARISNLGALRRLLGRSEVIRVHPDEQHTASLQQSLPLIRQPQAVQIATGAGTSVAVLDTGVDYTRPAFGSCQSPGVPAGCRVQFAYDFAPEDYQLDANGHGTNVAGIVAGVAPGTSIIALDVFRADNLAYSSDYLAAINWVIANRDTFNIVSLNMSLGSPPTGPGDCSGNVAATAFLQARSVGIIPVIAAGNNAVANGISSPACAPGAFSVGAVYDANLGSQYWSICTDLTTSADQVTCFSNASRNLSLLAPGSSIFAAGTTMSGTSQAAPHAAGALAVARSAFPLEDGESAANRLILAGQAITDPRSGMIKPRLDLYAAIATPNLRTHTSYESWAYGQGGFWWAQKWMSGDFDGDGRADLVNVFNDSGYASADVHASTGASFGIQRWETRQGGFWDAQKWLTGDFNGDGRTDLANVFNCSGYACIDVHLSTGSSFYFVRWASYQGGFWDAQQWIAGDFNGDGRDDIANVFSDSGYASVDVHLSSGSDFGIQRWATQQGAFWNSQKWLAGDFNGDGRADVAAVFTDAGSASIDVHVSSGSAFAFQRWATMQGAFWDEQVWMAGDFNGDGRDDLIKAFDDQYSGMTAIDVHVSSGNAFTLTRQESQQSPFYYGQKWLVGDYSGDGRADVSAVYDSGYGLATIEVHR